MLNEARSAEFIGILQDLSIETDNIQPRLSISDFDVDFSPYLMLKAWVDPIDIH